MRKNVSDDEVAEGAKIFANLGATALKNRTPLKPTNIFERAAQYFRYGYKGRREPPPTFLKVRRGRVSSMCAAANSGMHSAWQPHTPLPCRC